MDFQLSDEQQLWKRTIHDFCEAELKPMAAEMDKNATFNREAVQKMGPLGLLGLNIPEEYGGAGVDAISAAIAIEEIAKACGGTALSIAAHNSLGCAAIANYGNEEQKQTWLPGLATGESGIGALALTEAGAGSDLHGGIQTRAELEGDQWVIKGNKAWITNGNLAPVVVTLCRTDPAGGSRSFSLILVPSDTPGFHVHPGEHKMGVRASPTHALSYDEVRVPADHVLEEVGRGLYQTLEILDGGRIGIGALSIGLAQAALDEAKSYALERQSFGSRLADHQSIQWMIADAAMEIEGSRLMIYQAAWLKDQGLPYTKEAAMAKLHATEMAEEVCRNSIQILGSYGYSKDYPLERFYRDARLMTIGEGTSEVQRMVIAKRELS